MTNTQTIDVRSRNRLGITHEIISVFSTFKVDLVGLEMETHHTFIQFVIPSNNLLVDKIIADILRISDVIEIKFLDLLPSEAKRIHLDALLSNLPDPIFDIDEQGRILKVNNAATKILAQTESSIYQHLITHFFNEPLEKILQVQNTSMELTCQEKSYFAEIVPIVTSHRNNTEVRGAVITLKKPERLGLTISSIQQNRFQEGKIIAESNEMREILTKTSRFAELDLPILIRGETGTGKEVLAKSIHENSSRRTSPFLAINCAALPENLMESELFGYSAGAFSGALKSGKPGLFELANGGTLFLDEIGEMSPYLQAKLLRFLQDYTFRRLGSSKENTVDVRIISATHRKLNLLFESNQFREDLYYRLDVLSLNIPPLRERIGDIRPLAKHFVKLAGLQVNHQNCHLTEDALLRLEAHHWPGNIRQLQNLIFRSVAIANQNVLSATDLAFNSSLLSKQAVKTNEEISSLKNAVESFEKNLFEQLIKQFPTTRQLASRLSVSHNTIATKLRKYKLN